MSVIILPDMVELSRNKLILHPAQWERTPPAVDAITKGTSLKADVIQYPDKIGISTIQQIKLYFSGQTVPKVLPVDVGIVDRASLEQAKTN